LTSSIEIKEG
jgi:hypothetical protein